MNADRLLTHYERIADAPEAIPRFRRLILDLAVRGKLVNQDPNDKPVADLLQRIADEKARLRKAGTVKKQTSLLRDGISALGSPIPTTWTTVRLVEVSNIVMGQSPPGLTYNTDGDGVPLINGPLEFTDGPFGNTVVNQYTTAPTNTCNQGDFLICIRGSTTGRSNIAAFDACIGRGVAAIQPLFEDGFVRHFLWSMRERIIAMGRGIAFPSITRKQLENLSIPLPPLAEQHRIVAKVEELMALCDQLEAARTERETTRNRLAASSLARLNAPDPDSDRFGNHADFALRNLTPLTTRPDQIEALRQTILNLAIRGKLVAQDPNDEPASELLDRIALEKARMIKTGEIKGHKRHQPAAENQGTFQIPTSWSWCRLGSLTKVVTSGSRDWAKYYSNEGAIFVRMGNLSKNHYQLRLDNIQRVMAPSEGEGTRTRLEAGDLLISITGDVGMLGLIPEDFGEAYINQHTAMVRPMDEMSSRYLPELFRSPFAQEQFNAPQRGIKNSFRLTDITQFLVPLPPLAEQHRIVAKIDQLMALCDRLEDSLANGDYARRRLLETVLHDALESDDGSKAAA